MKHPDLVAQILVPQDAFPKTAAAWAKFGSKFFYYIGFAISCFYEKYTGCLVRDDVSFVPSFSSHSIKSLAFRKMKSDGFVFIVQEDIALFSSVLDIENDLLIFVGEQKTMRLLYIFERYLLADLEFLNKAFPFGEIRRAKFPI